MSGRRLTAQQKDERRQDNNDKKRLARHHPSDLLHSLTRERIGGGQHGIVSPALRASPFQSFRVLRVRHLMRIRIPSKLVDECQVVKDIRFVQLIKLNLHEVNKLQCKHQRVN